MPELPEVETVRRGLADRLNGYCIEKIEVCRENVIASPGGATEFIAMMKGALVGKWARRGKYLLASLSRKQTNQNHKSIESQSHYGWWGVHLRMTGQFQWHETTSSPCSHTRVRFWDKEDRELRFVDTRNFGQMWWIPSDSFPEKVITGLKHLGPEPFSKAFNASYLQKKLKGKVRSIKSSLLDQSLVAGVGNIYADESLFAARINPKRHAGSITEKELETLCNSLIEVLRLSIGEGGTTFSDFRDLEGLNGNYGGQAWVYRRGGKPCKRCGGIIQREKVCGRSTHWCSNCQE